MANASKLQPLGGYILVKPTKAEEKTASGLIVQTSSKGEKPQRGEVVSLGTGLLDDKGSVVPFNVKVGDVVLFKKYSPEEIEVEGEEFLIMKESDILAIDKS